MPLIHFNLAPLSTRRDIALLGVIHRAVLCEGPTHFQGLFRISPANRIGLRRRHSRHLIDTHSGRPLDMYNRSIFGLVRVYNLLPEYLVNLNTVKDFQSGLQGIVKERALRNCNDWELTLSPRVPCHSHPLLNFASALQ